MAASDYHDRFVTLRNGPIVPAQAYLLLLDLERRDFRITREGQTLIVQPPARLTTADCTAIRRWKWHLLGLLDYCQRPDNDAHLFTDNEGAHVA
ncbi:MAG TPA: hypothetical protein VNJ04_05415 [Gemmatimonadaceae bacterium]|nr:hypothetical protein [Gemmatimonadaceae bacterium]